MREPLIWALFVLIALGGAWGLWGGELRTWLGKDGARERLEDRPSAPPTAPPGLM